MGAKVTQNLQENHTDGMLTCNRRWNVDGRGCASCLFDSLLDRAKHWQIEMRLACLLGIDSPDHLCAILDGLCVQHCNDQLAATKVCGGKTLAGQALKNIASNAAYLLCVEGAVPSGDALADDFCVLV